MADRQRVAVVTGGGGGIGAAIAEELGRAGAYVVTMDPLVSVDGSEQLPTPEETTAGRIVAAGGSARASSVSVTDADGVRQLFDELVEELGGLDAVVNVAGITRPTSFSKGTEDGLAERARRAPGRIPQHPQRRAPDHGCRRARPDPRRHLRLRLAPGQHRCVRLRQARRRLPHLAARPAGAPRRRRERHVTDRRHPDGHRCPQPCPSGRTDGVRRLGHRRPLAGLDAHPRGPGTAGRPPPRRRASPGAAVG